MRHSTYEKYTSGDIQMTNERRIQTIKDYYTALQNKTIQSKIESLIDKINEARNARTSWTPAIESVIGFLEAYQRFDILQREHILNRKTPPDLSICDDAKTLCNFGTDILAALTKEIKDCRIDLNIGKRSVSALKGLGLIVAGIICSVFTIVVRLFLVGAPKELIPDIAGTTKNCFIDAFASFKETFTGKAECQELKDLASEVKKMNDDIARFSPQSKPFSIFAKPVTPSAPLSTPLANATHQH